MIVVLQRQTYLLPAIVVLFLELKSPGGHSKELVIDRLNSCVQVLEGLRETYNSPGPVLDGLRASFRKAGLQLGGDSQPVDSSSRHAQPQNPDPGVMSSLSSDEVDRSGPSSGAQQIPSDTNLASLADSTSDSTTRGDNLPEFDLDWIFNGELPEFVEPTHHQDFNPSNISDNDIRENVFASPFINGLQDSFSVLYTT
jgi:hypothetical protein